MATRKRERAPIEPHVACEIVPSQVPERVLVRTSRIEGATREDPLAGVPVDVETRGFVIQRAPEIVVPERCLVRYDDGTHAWVDADQCEKLEEEQQQVGT